jgi:hypothetical protein
MDAITLWDSLDNGVEIELPSGVTVKVKPFALHDYVEHGDIPSMLQGRLHAMAMKTIEEIAKEMEEDPVEYLSFISFVVEKSLVSPKFSEVKGVIPILDKVEIVKAALKPIKTFVDKLAPLS